MEVTNELRLAYMSTFLTEERKELFNKIADSRTNYITVAVEDVQKDHNSNAIIRSCDCFGVQTLHVINYQKSNKLANSIAKGAELWVDVEYHQSDEGDASLEAINALRAKGYKIVATTPHTNDCELPDFVLDEPIALFFGTEYEGLSQTVMDHADVFLKIPLHGFTESLNVSVSTAIILNDLTTRLQKSGGDFWKLSKEEMIKMKLNWCMTSIRRSDRILQLFEQNPEAYLHLFEQP